MQLTKWLTVSGDYFLVGHGDLGTSLVSAESLLADHKTFNEKAEVSQLSVCVVGSLGCVCCSTLVRM